MKFYITRKTLVGVILALCGVIFFLALSGCGSRGSLPGGETTPGLHGIPKLIQSIAVAVSGMATVALIICGIALAFVPNKLAVAKFALAALAALVSAGILWYLAAYWALAIFGSAFVLLLGVFGYGYVHRKDIDRRTGIDLNRDGKIGT